VIQCGLLKASYQARSDIETQFTIVQSNLKMAAANNEMLEDALKRHSASKDVGWRRAPAARMSVDEASADDAHPNWPDSAPPTPPPNQPNQTKPSEDSRFFRFRFSSGRTTPVQLSTPSSPPPTATRLPGTTSPGHLTSASLPSLVQPIEELRAKELEEFRAKLAEESEKLAKAVNEKHALENELETLSQALFEEVRSCLVLIANLGTTVSPRIGPTLLLALGQISTFHRQTRWWQRNASNVRKQRKSSRKPCLRRRRFEQR
jgi:hypothetical protein